MMINIQWIELPLAILGAMLLLGMICLSLGK
jgi:hypothetical protein